MAKGWQLALLLDEKRKLFFVEANGISSRELAVSQNGILPWRVGLAKACAWDAAFQALSPPGTVWDRVGAAVLQYTLCGHGAGQGQRGGHFSVCDSLSISSQSARGEQAGGLLHSDSEVLPGTSPRVSPSIPLESGTSREQSRPFSSPCSPCFPRPGRQPPETAAGKKQAALLRPLLPTA